MNSKITAQVRFVSIPTALTKDQYEKLRDFLKDLFKDVKYTVPPVVSAVYVCDPEPEDEKESE